MLLYMEYNKFPWSKFTPMYDDIEEVIKALIKHKLLVSQPKSQTHPSFSRIVFHKNVNQIIFVNIIRRKDMKLSIA